METNKDIFVLTADLGYKMFDQISVKFPDRFFNIGAAEQSMLDMGVGLTLSGKIPVLYSITPFLLYRGFETLRTYINYESSPVKLIGAGRGKDYLHDGISHWAIDDLEIIAPLRNIKIEYPLNKEDVANLFPRFLLTNEPTYINLTRKV